MNGTNMTGTTTNAGPLPSYWFVCKYCHRTFNQHSVLVLHKLESHPLEYAEEKRIQSYERIHQTGIEPYSNYFSGGHMNGPMETLNRTNYSYEHHNQIHSSSTVLNGPLLTRTQVIENFGERRQTPTSLRVPGSYPAGELPSFHSAMWQEVDIPIRPVRNEPVYFQREEPSVTLHHQPHNFDPPLEKITSEHLVHEQTCPTIPQKHQTPSSLESNRKVTDKLDLNNAPVHTDKEARGPIIKQEHGIIDGQDEFQSFQQRQSRPLGKMHDCYVCDAKFLTTEALRNHYRSHMEGALYKCQHCGCGFKTTLSRLKHLYLGKCAGYSALKTRNKMPKSLVERARGDALRQQQRAPPKKIWFSRDADVGRDQRNGLAEENNDGVPIVTDVRTLAKPPNRSLIQCPYCTKQLSSERLFQVHLRVHSGDKPYSCNACQAKFANVQGLATHSKSQRCGARKAFNEQNSAHGINNVTSMPEQSEQNQESTDTVTFYLADGANDPQGSGQTRQMLPPRASRDLQRAPGNITCPYCFKRFRSGYFLRVHLRIHTGDRPYICTQCEDRFVSAQSLSNHRRSHSKEGYYKCHQCNQLFTSERKRKVHVLRQCPATCDPRTLTPERIISESDEFSRNQSDEAEEKERTATAQMEDAMIPEVLFIDESTLTPLQKTAPAPWVIADRLRQIEIRPISHTDAEHAASALRSEVLTSVIVSMERVYKAESEVDLVSDIEEDSESDAFHIWNDHSYSYSVSDSSGSRLWEKARKNVKAIINQLPSHQCSKCRAFFTDDKFATHRCGETDTDDKNDKSNKDRENGSDCENSSETRRNDDEPSPPSSPQRSQVQSNSSLDRRGIKRIYQTSSMRPGRRPDARPGPIKGLGKFKCPLCDTRFRRTRTVRCHLITYHRVSTANQKALGFNRSSSSPGNKMTRLKALADNLNECIGQIVKTAESHTSIRAKFRRVGRSNSFEVDIDP